MPVRKLEDGTGDSIRVLDVDGFFTPFFDIVPNHEAEFRSIPDWKCRPDDIFICAYPKAGTHWLWEVTSMLLSQSADRINVIKEMYMIEGLAEENFDTLPSPRIMNTHLPFSLLPKDITEHKPKIIFVQRNPKDICVSYYNHHIKLLDYGYSGTWEKYIPRFLKGLLDYGSWFDYTLSWEKVVQDNPDLPVHIMSYEDMKKDAITEVENLSSFLNVKADRKLVEDIVENCGFDKMKKEKDPLENMAEWKEGQPGMYRKGQIGDWKNWFTVAQSEHFDAYFNEKMKDSSFVYQYS